MTNTEASYAYDVDDLIEEARELGRRHGREVGSWVIDGNVPSETRLEALQLDEAGDPAFEDRFGAPAPLSGEWADGPTPDGLLRELGVTPFDIGHGAISEEARREIEDAYEGAFYDAHRDEVLRAAAAGL